MKILHAIVSATVLGTGIALVPTATAAPTGPTNVEDLVMQIQADGHTAIVNRMGSRPAVAMPGYRRPVRPDFQPGDRHDVLRRRQLPGRKWRGQGGGQKR